LATNLQLSRQKKTLGSSPNLSSQFGSSYSGGRHFSQAFQLLDFCLGLLADLGLLSALGLLTAAVPLHDVGLRDSLFSTFDG